MRNPGWLIAGLVAGLVGLYWPDLRTWMFIIEGLLIFIVIMGWFESRQLSHRKEQPDHDDFTEGGQA